MQDTSLVVEAAIALSLALAGGLIARALRLPAIVGYLAAGLAIGPFTPGFTADAETIHELAELGVVFLMFGVGLHFNLGELLSVRRLAVPPSVAQTAAVAALAWGLGVVIGLPHAEALVFGMALSISSTVVLVRALEERALLPSIHGRMLIGWLIVQDLATIVMLALLPVFAGNEGGPAEALTSALRAVAFAAVVLLAGGRVVPKLLNVVGRSGSRELFVLVIVCVSLAIAVGAELAGVPLALGAFIAGVAVSETEASHQAASDVLPLRDAFAVLFFVSIGMLIDPSAIAEQPVVIVAALVTVLAIKPLVSAVVTGASPVPARAAFIAAAGLAQAGEFTFVLAEAGRALGVVSPPTYSAVLAASAISIALNPLAFVGAGLLERRLIRGRIWGWLDRQGTSPLAPAPPRDHVVVAGAGRVGRLAARALGDVGIPVVMVDASLETVRDLQQQGHSAYWGDVGGPAVLNAAGIADARLLVLAVPDAASGGLAARHARAVNAGIAIVARAHSRAELPALHSAGVNVTVVPEFEGGVAIVRESLRLLDNEEALLASVSATIRSLEYGEPPASSP